MHVYVRRFYRSVPVTTPFRLEIVRDVFQNYMFLVDRFVFHIAVLSITKTSPLAPS